MLEMLAAYGLPSTIINVRDLLYEHTEARIIISDSETEFFKMSKSVLQGETLAPFLFITNLDYVMRQGLRNQKGSRLDGYVYNKTPMEI